MNERTYTEDEESYYDPSNRIWKKKLFKVSFIEPINTLDSREELAKKAVMAMKTPWREEIRAAIRQASLADIYSRVFNAFNYEEE